MNDRLQNFDAESHFVVFKVCSTVLIYKQLIIDSGYICVDQGPLLLTLFNFNSSMDK